MNDYERQVKMFLRQIDEGYANEEMVIARFKTLNLNWEKGNKDEAALLTLNHLIPGRIVMRITEKGEARYYKSFRIYTWKILILVAAHYRYIIEYYSSETDAMEWQFIIDSVPECGVVYGARGTAGYL